MRYLILMLVISAAAYGAYWSWTYETPAQCDQAELDAHSAAIGAYEITCEELEEL